MDYDPQQLYQLLELTKQQVLEESKRISLEQERLEEQRKLRQEEEKRNKLIAETSEKIAVLSKIIMEKLAPKIDDISNNLNLQTEILRLLGCKSCLPDKEVESLKELLFRLTTQNANKSTPIIVTGSNGGINSQRDVVINSTNDTNIS